jgi:threonine dehydratase
MRVIDNETATETSYDALQAVTIADIWKAHKLLKPLLHHTPLTLSRTLHDLTGANIYLKAENMQRSGSFKVRGASYKLSRLSAEEYRQGVIAASAGNHAQGVAIAAANYHIPCTIVMPETAPLAKVTATQGYGAEVVLHGFTYDDAYQHCLDL